MAKATGSTAPVVKRRKGTPGEDGKTQIAIRVTPEEKSQIDLACVLARKSGDRVGFLMWAIRTLAEYDVEGFGHFAEQFGVTTEEEAEEE